MRYRNIIIAAVVACLGASSALASDSVKYGTAIKLSPVYYLPVLAAQEQGIFEKNDLTVEWLPAKSGGDFERNLAASIIDIGSSSAANDIPGISRGVPAKVVANLQNRDAFAVWVKADSKIKSPEDLNGATIGVSRLSGAEHSYAELVASRLGLKDVKYVGTGGIRESLAVLTTGVIDAVVLQPQNLINLMLDGQVRRIVEVNTFLPKPWLGYTINASDKMINERPDVVKRVLASIFEANRFIMSEEGKPWALKTMIEQNHYSPEGAEQVYSDLALSADGKTDIEAVTNAIMFLEESGVVQKGEVSGPDAVFTDQFIQ